MKKILFTTTIVTFFLAVSMLMPAYSAPTVIKVGHVSEGGIRLPGTGRSVALEVFKTYVEANSEGRLKLEIHPDGSLGNARSLLEQCQLGVVPMVGSYTAVMTPFCQELATLQIPFLFKDSLVAWKVLRGPFGKELAKKFREKTGMRILYWGEGSGFRNIYTVKGKVVKSPADLKGLKMRVPENPGLLALFRALGTNTVTITWTELYNALQTGMAEACDTELFSMYKAKLYEVTPNITMSMHGYNVHPIILPFRICRLQKA
jgi:TRAP-type transport system periplasmic protein